MLQVKFVQTRFTIVIDDDVIFTRHTRLEDLIDVLKQNPSVGLAGGTYEVCCIVIGASKPLPQIISVS